MAFGSTKNLSPEEPKPLGIQSERLPTNEAARILPWFAGTRWLGVTWIGDVFHVRTTPIRAKVGKKKTTVGYNYYACFAALIGCGPADIIHRIRCDDVMSWTGPLSRNESDDYVSITVPDRGIIRFRWGTETQTIDDDLEAANMDHSAMRGQIYLSGYSFYFGADRTTPPAIQVELSRFPIPPFLTRDESIIENIDSNPIAVLWEWWCGVRFGLGRSIDELDIPRLTATAQTLKAEGIGISPLLDTPMKLRDAIIHLMEHIDGYPTSYNGKFGIELIRQTAPVLTATKAHLLSDPRIRFQSWSDTFNEVRVKFKDYELEGGDNVAKYHDAANFLITGTHRSAPILDRPWVIRHAVALGIAGAEGRVQGQPNGSGSASFRHSQVGSVQLGSLIHITTRDGGILPMRVTSRSEPTTGMRSVDVELESDRGWANAEHYAPPADEVPETPIYEPLPPEAVRIYGAPFAMQESRNLAALLYMVARRDSYSTGYDIWKSLASDSGYSAASERQDGSLFSSFSVKAQLTSEYAPFTLPIDTLTGIEFELLTTADQEMLEDEWDLAAGLNHELLAVFGYAADPDSIAEVMSLFNVVKTGATTYTADTVRGLYDTRRRVHADNQEFWIQLRTRFDWDAWPPLSTSPRYYKIQTVFGNAELDLGDVTPVEHSEDARTFLPIAPFNVRFDGDRNAPTWTSGNDGEITWNNTSRARTVFGFDLGDAPATDLDAVVLEIRSYDTLTLLDTLIVPATESYEIASAYLVATVNADFSVRAYGLRSGRRSLDYTEVAVRKTV